MLDEHAVVARVRRLHLRELRLWVQQGWVRPSEGRNGPVFDELDIARIRLVRDLRKDMALPSDTVPVILSLLDQLHGLRRELRGLAGAVDEQPEETRAQIVQAYRRLTSGEE